jgi:hypothetical protein
MKQNENKVYPEQINNLILKDFENYLEHGMPKAEKGTEDDSYTCKLFNKLVYDGSARILKWYKKFPNFYILGRYDLYEPQYEKIALILNDNIIDAYKTNCEDNLKCSCITPVDPHDEYRPINIMQHPDIKNRYILQYYHDNMPKIIEINVHDNGLYVSEEYDKIVADIKELYAAGPENKYFKYIQVITDTNSVAMMHESLEPLEIIWSGKLKFKTDLFNNYEIDINIPVYTEVYNLYQNDTKMHVITRKKALSDVAKYLNTLSLDETFLSFFTTFIINFDERNDAMKVMLLIKELYKPASVFSAIMESIEFIPVTVSHPFAVDLGLHIVGLEPKAN